MGGQATVKRKGTEGKRRFKRQRTHVQRRTLLAELRYRINEYAEAMVAESWKGGGDPADIPVVEAQLELSKAKLDAHLERMEREHAEM
jgi:hypothetical protein